MYNWAKIRHPELYLFQNLKTNSTINVKWKDKQGQQKNKKYIRTSANITYYSKKFFGVPPYFFRHNRFSDMMIKGAKIQDIIHNKGAKDARSAMIYVHLSEKAAKESSKYLY